MKTSLIQLGPGADWRGALDRIRGGAQGRVVLVWPDRGEPRSPRLVLQIAARRSQRLRVPLALVCTKKDIAALAGQSGLPTFATARQARAAKWGLAEKISIPKSALSMEGIYLRIMAEDRRARSNKSK